MKYFKLYIFGLLALLLTNNAYSQIQPFHTNIYHTPVACKNENLHMVIDSVIGIAYDKNDLPFVAYREQKDRDWQGLIHREWLYFADEQLILKPSILKINSYDEQRRPTSFVYHHWDKEIEEYIEQEKLIFRYEENSPYYISTYYKKNELGDYKIIDSTRTLIHVNEHNLPSDIYINHFRNGEWKDSIHEKYTYNVDTKLAKKLISTYDSTENTWKNSIVFELDYLSNKQSASAVELWWNGQYWYHPHFKIGNQEFIINRHVYYSMIKHYIFVMNEDKNMSQSTIANESNKNSFYINSGNKEAIIQILDIRGNIIDRQRFSGIKVCDMSNYKKGIYLIKIQIDQTTTTRKVMIK